MFNNFLDNLSFPLPKFVLDSDGICPNWILPLDLMSFGVEVECYDDDECVGEIGSYHDRNENNHIHSEFLPDSKGNLWKIEEDGSLNDEEGGMEFVSPILYGSEGIDIVCDSLDILKNKGFSVNKDCGLHIHIGLSGIVGKNKVDDQVSFLGRLVKSMFNYQGSLYGSCGRNRRDRNHCCRPLRSNENLISLVNDVSLKSKGSKSRNDFRDVVESSRKYRSLNISKLRNSFGGNNPSSSIEFRFPQGSLNKRMFLLHIIQIMFLVRQSWVDRHNRKDRDKICDDWNLSKRFQLEENKNKEGILGYEKLSNKIQNSIRGKWLKYENKNLNYYWEDIFNEWKNKGLEYDSNYPS
ncbi:MAG TPA: hypothetical protein EYQ21_00200 [Flavobacteriales bacterium]|nr:hypothetical protein [Flavobacteriales bacterium]